MVVHGYSSGQARSEDGGWVGTDLPLMEPGGGTLDREGGKVSILEHINTPYS